MIPAEIVERVLAEHAPYVGPISGSWTCPPPCNTISTNGLQADDTLTSRKERAAEHRAHVAAAVVEALGEAEVQWGVRYLPPYPDTTTAGFPMPSERHARELVADSVGEAVVVHRSRIVGPWVEDGA